MSYRPKSQIPVEMPMPRSGEVVGTVIKSLGASNFLVAGSDGNERICTIPGRLRRRFWIKVNDTVLIKPWVVQGDKRGDIIWRYSIMDRETLKARGIKIP